MRGTLVAFAAFGAICLVGEVAHADMELTNDSFVTGGQVAVQGGFVAGEMAASRFFVAAPTTLLSVKVVFANETAGGATRDVTLHVWSDDASSAAPGAEIFTADFTLTPSQSAFSTLSTTSETVAVSGYFRVGIEVHHAGPPSVVNDTDGFSNAANSLLYGDVGLGTNWYRTQMLGVSGDWVLRAVVAGGSTGVDAGVIDAPSGGPDAGGGGPDGGGGGGTCAGNGDCDVGSYCDPNLHTCTFDCRNDNDCGSSDQCNSLGQCVAADGEAGGCCSTGTGGGMAGSMALGAGVALLLARRRRNRAA